MRWAVLDSNYASSSEPEGFILDAHHESDSTPVIPSSEQDPSSDDGIACQLEPETVGELLADSRVTAFIRTGLVFIHHKRGPFERLMGQLIAPPAADVDIRAIKWDLPDERVIATLARAGRPLRQRRVNLLDFSCDPQRGSHLIRAVAGMARRDGLWVVGYVADMSSAVLRLFDAYFAFDMALRDYDTLRGVIPISSASIRSLRSAEEETSAGSVGAVLVYLSPQIDGAPLLLGPIPLSSSLATAGRRCRLAIQTVLTVTQPFGNRSVGPILVRSPGWGASDVREICRSGGPAGGGGDRVPAATASPASQN